MSTQSPSISLAPIGVALHLIGDVFVEGIDGLIRMANPGERLHLGESIRVGTACRIVVGFPDGTSLCLDGEVEALLDHDVFDPYQVDWCSEPEQMIEAMQRAVRNGIEHEEILRSVAEGGTA